MIARPALPPIPVDQYHKPVPGSKVRLMVVGQNTTIADNPQRVTKVLMQTSKMGSCAVALAAFGHTGSPTEDAPWQGSAPTVAIAFRPC